MALGVPHDLRIVWGATAVDYYVDGALVVSHPTTLLSVTMRVYASNNGPAALGLDSLRVGAYAAGSSRLRLLVKDAGALDDLGQPDAGARPSRPGRA